MAEQISHNVVNNSQSASGFPLVDAVANHTTTATAATGTHFNPTINADPNPEAKVDANGPNDTIQPDSKRSDAGPTAAEPSAGDAAAPPTGGPVAKEEEVNIAEKNDGKAHDSPQSVKSGGPEIEATGIEDVAVHDVSTDPSVTSDTEGARADTQSKDETRHLRTNSVKKPVSFSKVSVTKNFMAKTATAPIASRIGEKAAATPASAAVANAPKPRLIAKTGASVSALQKARQNADSPSGPDASRVWNKNKAPTPQPAKQFTDEELKQQYGIHLATRLQSDEKAGESKWADIDEDEDDWVPEQVVWVDGTKSSLAPADSTPVPKPAEPASLPSDKLAENAVEKPTETPAEKPVEAAKPPAQLLKRPSEPAGPPKTILKPGAAAQAKQSGVSSPSPGPDKAVLKAKSPAPAPVKSPWAALPPVERASPINPPVQQQAPPPPMFQSQDARAYESSMPLSQPTREIAADTFDRSWREGEGERRELFNSTNGRYEPAPEGRRSSMKPEAYGRKHALLQRPSQSGAEPAGPSSAFQTRSGSQTDGPPAWGRRRGSSVSHAGMPPPRRMSTNKSPDHFAISDRRSSNAASHEALASPSSIKNDQQPMFSQQSAWQQQMPPPPPPGAQPQQEDMVKVQERVMKEKIAGARKRRQEEEEKNEAAKQERLKAKLAALEGAGQSRKSRAEAAAAPASEASASERRPTDNKAENNQNIQEHMQPPKMSEVASAAAPSLEAQVAQQATMPEAKAPSPEKLELPSPIPKPQDAGLPGRSASSEQTSRLTPRAHVSPQAGQRVPFQQNVSSPYRAPTSAYSSPGDRKQQPFNRSTLGSSDTFSPWPTGSGGGNVWGSSGIGNGTFESSPSFGSMPIPQQGTALLPPPGMSRPAANHMSPQMLGQDSRSPSLQQSQLSDQARAFGPPGIEPRPDHFMPQPRVNGPSPIPGMGRQQHVPGPIAPPSRAQPPQNQRPAPTPTGGISAWNQASKSMGDRYSAMSAIGPPKKDAGEVGPPRDDTIKEVFKQRQPNGKYAKAAHLVHDANGTRTVASHTPAPPSTQTQPSVPIPTASPLNVHGKQPGENTVRIPDGSMNPAHGGRPAQQLPIGAPRQPGAMRNINAVAKVEPQPPAVSSKEQSPPPPDAATHPAYTGDPRHPHVRLPQARPKVKLPPAQTPVAQQEQSVVMPQRPVQSWGPPGAARPLAQTEAWQARFNGLFNRIPTHTETPPSPPKTPPKAQDVSLAVNSASRMVMDDSAAAAATVSLPQVQIRKITSPEGFTIDESKEVTSKEPIEPLFNEELSFGSKPTTRMPRNVVYRDADPNAKNMLGMALNSRFNRPIEPNSRVELDVHYLHPVNNRGVFVNIPGVKTKHNPIFWRYKGSQKPAGRLNKGKGPAGPAAAATAREGKSGSPVSAAPNGNPATHSRKTSYQKAPAPTNAPVSDQNVPAAGAANIAPQAGNKRQSNYKSRGGRQQGAATAAPAPVKST